VKWGGGFEGESASVKRKCHEKKIRQKAMVGGKIIREKSGGFGKVKVACLSGRRSSLGRGPNHLGAKQPLLRRGGGSSIREKKKPSPGGKD